jgi:hypothetical protein
LLAVDDVLDGGFFGILTSDQIALDILIGSKRVGDGARDAIVRGEDENVTLSVAIAVVRLASVSWISFCASNLSTRLETVDLFKPDKTASCTREIGDCAWISQSTNDKFVSRIKDWSLVIFGIISRFGKQTNYSHPADFVDMKTKIKSAEIA